MTAALSTLPTGLRGSPVAGPVEVVRAEADTAATRFTVSAAEPVLPGHYPGFPIFPGVCLVECAHLSALATAPAAMELCEIESTRFTGPVYPGDVITVDLRRRTNDDGTVRCTAEIASERGKAAKVRLKYRVRTAETGEDV